MTPPRLLVCEDDPRYARLLRRVLERPRTLEVLPPAGSGEEACRLARSLHPDLLLLDLELPGMGGLEVIRRLMPLQPGLEVLVLTSFADEDRVFEAMCAGAAGYLVKGLTPELLLAAIDDVLAGGTVLEPSLARRFWRYFAASRGHSGQDFGLDADELEVLALVGRGLTNPEAARALGQSRRRVKATLERIFRKMGVSSRVEATARAVSAGLLEL